MDLIVRNGTIYDGSGNKPVKADIAIVKDRIVGIGNYEDILPRDEIDASGLCIMPGFIDTHLHSDMTLLFDRQHASALGQGITTGIIGQDGLSYAPLSIDNLKMYAKYLRGLNGYFEDIPLDFTTVDSYLDKFHKKVGINVAYQVPHGAIRLEALGFNDIPLKGYALDKAKDLIRQGFEDGAVAFSTGLSYFPCSYSDTDEMVELCKVCAEYDVPYVTHIRSVFRGEFYNATLEAIEIAKRAGCSLHFSHYRTGPDNCGKAEELMEPIEEAISEGIKITLELYPYYSGSGYPVVFLPPWVVEGGYQATIDRLADPSLRSRIIQGMKENTIPIGGIFTHLTRNEEYIGRDFEDVAKERGQSKEDMLCDILLEEELDVGYFENPYPHVDRMEQMDRDFIWLLSKPYYMVGSDSIPYGFKPHPRAFGAFPRFLRLAREKGMPFETFANRTSALPAETFRLKDRGYIKEGYYADLVIFDVERVRDNATYKNPRRRPDGIEYVVVNGKIALYKEKVTGLFNGYAVSRDR